MMKIILNGKEQDVNDETNLFDLLTQFQIKNFSGVAVAVNDDVISQSEWEETKLKTNDQIDIVQAVQGG